MPKTPWESPATRHRDGKRAAATAAVFAAPLPFSLMSLILLEGHLFFNDCPVKTEVYWCESREWPLARSLTFNCP